MFFEQFYVRGLGHASYLVGSDETGEALLFDPQTSGGLQLGSGTRRAKRLEATFERDGLPLWRLGRVAKPDGQAGITVQ